ncbi:hypothetical protein COCON_G00042680, partial [Conger conger]
MLTWVEYGHNTLPCAATGKSPFEISLGYQPPLFPDQEAEIAVPSLATHMKRCAKIWRDAKAALLRTADRNRRFADRHRTPAPAYKNRAMALRSVPGSLPVSFWTNRSSETSIVTTLINSKDRQESVVKGGVLSRFRSVS